MDIYEPTLEFLRQALGNDIVNCHAELIKIAIGWSHVYRVTLTHTDHSINDSVVVKTIDPNGPATSLELERELRFYQILHPELCIAKPLVYFAATDEVSGFHVIVMEDLAAEHRIPTHPHQWKRDELASVLRAYAQLHTTKVQALEHPWLAPRHESLLDFEKIPEQVATVQNAGIWNELPHLSSLIAYARESIQKYANEKMSLLHGDTTPPNAALPKKMKSQPAVLIDWQDVGIGMPEFDLAYIDLQPYNSARLIPRSELLYIYWDARAVIDPNIPMPDERKNRQLHADLITALWLTAPASRVALHPFPEGSYPQLHWASQYGIVYNRLKSLSEEITR